MKGFFACLFVLLLIPRIQAGENYVTGGINSSRFYDVGSKPVLGYSLG